MTPHRLIRWESFWFGILVLGFLAFAWVRSSSHADFLNWKLSDDLSIAGGQHGGIVDLWVDRTHSEFSPVGIVVGSNRSTERRWFESELFAASNGIIKVSHLLAMLLFSLCWGGWLFWRVRKQGNKNQ
jgi:hypothetical protein